MELQTKLVTVADVWVATQRRAKREVSLETLSSRATSDGKLFKRLSAGRPLYVGTLERVLLYLAIAENWPNGLIPAEALRVLGSPLFQMHQAA